MRKAIVLALLIVLATMPLQTSAQVSVPAVDLHCLNIHGEVYDSATVDENTTQGILAVINSSENEPTANVTCTLTNPNSYAERIQIQYEIDSVVPQVWYWVFVHIIHHCPLSQLMSLLTHRAYNTHDLLNSMV